MRGSYSYLGVKEADLVPIRVFSLKRCTVGAFTSLSHRAEREGNLCIAGEPVFSMSKNNKHLWFILLK